MADSKHESKTVFIDGENFRQNLADVLLNQKLIKDKNEFFKVDVRALIEDIVGEKGIEITYYASAIKTSVAYEPSKEILRQINMIREKSRRWTALLKNQNIKYVKAGSLKVKEGKKCPYCHKTSDILQEKGVDVRVALGMFETAYSNNNQDIIVVSSDTDLCPTYHKIQRMKKNIRTVYVCFSEKVNHAVSAATTETITITPQKVKQYFIEPKSKAISKR